MPDKISQIFQNFIESIKKTPLMFININARWWCYWYVFVYYVVIFQDYDFFSLDMSILFILLCVKVHMGGGGVTIWTRAT